MIIDEFATAYAPKTLRCELCLSGESSDNRPIKELRISDTSDFVGLCDKCYKMWLTQSTFVWRRWKFKQIDDMKLERAKNILKYGDVE